ncbi:unnamed protein product [Notodromas monacha]|uniref:Uncharacterized protein n=1 Tax=Notodromas monacha TaxID=399045 RepID=A0A7R9GBU0_9CRUS|nr:unnamed protein product [Notodromas monacha]CAG0916743.1 unnamed protein product [Notodromas monacha]
MTPAEYLYYLFNSMLLGEEPTIEDVILLVGTGVALIAFILWCCFPIVPKEPVVEDDDSKYMQQQRTEGYDPRMY